MVLAFSQHCRKGGIDHYEHYEPGDYCELCGKQYPLGGSQSAPISLDNETPSARSTHGGAPSSTIDASRTSLAHASRPSKIMYDDAASEQRMRGSKSRMPPRPNAGSSLVSQRVVGGKSRGTKTTPRTEFVDRQYSVCVEVLLVPVSVTRSGADETGTDLYTFADRPSSIDTFQASFKESFYLDRPIDDQPTFLEFLLSFGAGSLQPDGLRSSYEGFQDLYMYNGVNPDTLQPIKISESCTSGNMPLGDILSNFPRSRQISQVKIAVEVWTVIKDKSRKGKRARGKTQRGGTTPKPAPTVYDQKRRVREYESNVSLTPASEIIRRAGDTSKRRRLYSHTPSDKQISPLWVGPRRSSQQRDFENSLMDEFLAGRESQSPVSVLREIHNRNELNNVAASAPTGFVDPMDTIETDVGRETTKSEAENHVKSDTAKDVDEDSLMRVTRARARQM